MTRNERRKEGRKERVGVRVRKAAEKKGQRHEYMTSPPGKKIMFFVRTNHQLTGISLRYRSKR